MTEEQLHRACVEWAEWKSREHPELGLLFHVPNGGSRHRVEAKKLKGMGVKPGVPDLCLPVRRGLYGGAWFELKSETGRVRPNQRWWLEQLREQGFHVSVVRSIDEFIDGVTWYLGI